MSETINEGAILFNDFEEKMKDNSYVLDVIKNVLTEINKFSNQLGVIILLKDESFRERHWNVNRMMI